MLGLMKTIFTGLLLTLLSSCSSNSDNALKTVDDITYISEFINQQFKSVGEMIDPQASPLTCYEGTSNFNNSCLGVENFINTLTFDGCQFNETSQDPENLIQEQLFGQINYIYNTSTCQMTNIIPASLVQLLDVTIEGRSEGELRVFSQQRSNYLNQSVGGGLAMTVQNLENKFNVDIIGIHQTILDANNQFFMDISVQTLSPILVQGTETANLAIEGGEMEVTDNLNQQTFKFLIQSINYSLNCKCPTSGTIVGEVTNGAKGNFNLEYKSCGDLEITYSDGIKEAVSLPLCF